MEEPPESEPNNPAANISMESPAILHSPIEEGDGGTNDGFLKEQAEEEGDGVVGEVEVELVGGGALLVRAGEEQVSESLPIAAEEGGGDGVIDGDGLLKNGDAVDFVVRGALSVRSGEESELEPAGVDEENQAPAFENQMEEEELLLPDNEMGVSEFVKEEMESAEEEDMKEANAPSFHSKEELKHEMKEEKAPLEREESDQEMEEKKAPLEREESEQERKEKKIPLERKESEQEMEEKKAPLENEKGTETCQSNVEEMEPQLPKEEKSPLIQSGEGSEKIEPEKLEDLEEVASENPVEGGEDDKMAVDDATDASTKVAAKRSAKGHKKVSVRGREESLDDEDAEDGPAKAAGNRSAKIHKKTPAKDRDDVAGEGEAKEAKVESSGLSKMEGSSGTLSGKKRGRPRTSEGGRIRGPPKQKEDEESLCFICFDGGDLVVCDHRGCPKVYHPSCVNRDNAYFQAKGLWNCGWHICSKCKKSARYMCYTCTYSLCKGCIKEAGFVFVRKNKGFCETCIKTVMLIETNEYEDETMAGLDFDDKNSWLYLFKDYWVELKEKLSLTLEELTRARTLSKDSNVVSQYEKPLDNLDEASDDKGGSSSGFPGGRKTSVSSSKKARKRSRKNKEDLVKEVEAEGTSSSEEPEWASKELLEFVAHMKDGDRSVLSQLEVQALLLQYIRLNNLRDPRNRGQIRCDSRLWTLFGKSRIGQLEMLKFLESHFLLKEASPLATDDNQGGVVDPDPSQMEGNSDASMNIALYMRRKSHRKVDGSEPAHIDDYAAIDVHNISFLYLRRNLMAELLNEIDTFNDNVVGSFVRIRISALGQKQDLYRLVQVVGTGKAAEKYRAGKRATDITLEILNLDKREYITIDIISNQDFTEEECKRLRQSVKCGLIDRFTVGDIQGKARALQNARVNDWLESEKLRLGNLRDRASEKGRKKELRECVEKLQLLNTPEERIRRLNEVPDIHADPHIDPDHESAEDEDLDSKKHDVYNRPESLYRGRDGLSTVKAASASLKISDTWDSNRSTPNDGDPVSPATGDKTYEFSGNRGNCSKQMGCSEISNPEASASIQNNNHSVMKPFESSTVPPETKPGSLSANAAPLSTPSETEKMWNYQDPSGKIQGPFSMTQLRKWDTNGFFPANLRIWRISEKQEDSILLTDSLNGKFHKDLAREEPQHNNSQPTNGAAVMNCRVNNLDGGCGGNINQQPPAGAPAMGDNSLTNANRWTTQPSSSPMANTVVVNPVDGRSAASSSDWESSKEGNAWRGQQQGNDSHRTSFPRNSSHYPSYHGRDDRGNIGRWNGSRGRQNNWNSNRQRRFQPNDRGFDGQHTYRSSSGQQFSREQWKSQPARQQSSGEQWKNQPARQQLSGEQWKNQPDNGSSNQLGNSFVNLPAPIPPQSGIDWTSLQGALNKILPPASSAHLMTSGQVQQSPVQTNVSNILSPALYSVGGWPSSSGTTDSSILVQENVHVSSNPQVPNQQNQTSEGAASNILNTQQGFSVSTSTGFHVPTSKYDGVAGDVQAANSQLNETGDPSIVPCRQPDSDKRSPEARDGSASESKSKSENGAKLDISSSLPTISGSSDLLDASAPAQRKEASSSSQVQPESQRLVPVSAQQQGPSGSGVNPAPMLNLGWGVAGQNPSMGTGTTQLIGNMVYGPAVQGAANIGWGLMAPGVMNMAWAAPANLNMVWAPPEQAIPNANLGMAVPAQGNANVNLARVPAAQGNTNLSTGFGVPMQGNSTLNSGWVVPTLGNTNPNPGWVAPIAGNTNQNAIWGTPAPGTVNNNMGMAWDPSGGNPNSRNPQT